MKKQAAEVVSEVAANYYCIKFDRAFEKKGKAFSQVSEVILGRGTLGFRFNDHSALKIEVADVGVAHTVWSTHCETTHARGRQHTLGMVA